MKILLFGGTTEGRQIAERLALSHHELTVCVATENGAEEISAIPGIQILTGEKGEEEIAELLAFYDLCIDATHPYAKVVSSTLRKTCARLGVPLRRVLRAAEEMRNVRTFDSALEAAHFLEGREGNVLLTIGTRALSDFASIIGERVYARILPMAEGIAACEAAGLKHKQIIAMQGPFSKEMNIALIRQYNIRYLVTKESGKEGGFREKAEAASECGAELLVIARPQDEGCSVRQLLEELMPEKMISADHFREILLVGCGIGERIPEEISSKIKADLLIGAPRLLENVSFSGAEKIEAAATADIEKIAAITTTDIEKIADTIRADIERIAATATADSGKIAATATADIVKLIEEHPDQRIAVLFSGDSGFYSGATTLIKKLEEMNLSIRVFPGISSVQYFAAKIKRPWQNWNLCSAHGKEVDLFGELRKGQPLFLLTGGAESARDICRKLTDLGYGDAAVTCGEAFGTTEERVRRGTACSFQSESFNALNVLLVEVPEEKLPKKRTPGIPDEEFYRSAVPTLGEEKLRTIPMTKQEVRAVLMAKLNPGNMEVAWDVGAGTGSVSVELALLSKEVWAVEVKEEACELIQRNRDKFCVRNLNVVCGRAPAALEQLPCPDIVFVGGSEGELSQILDIAFAKNPAVRIGVSAVSVETMSEAVHWMKKNEFRMEITEIQANRGKQAGSHHLMMANNPVFLIIGTKS